MVLSIIGSGSKGNGYVLQNENEALVIEAGVSFSKLSETVSHNLMKISGCIITHEHGDHAKHADKYIKSGIEIFMSKGTNDIMKKGETKASCLSEHVQTSILEKEKIKKIGRFSVIPFKVKHDAEEPLGFVINHPEIGNVLFVTDTYYITEQDYKEFSFININHFIIEANYCDTIVKRNFSLGKIHPANYYRLFKSHMSIQSTLKILKMNDISKCRNIVLIHLSDRNSDAASFKKQVEMQTGIPTVIAEPNVELNLSL